MPDRDVEIWAKLESFNAGSSAKDRTAAALFAAADRDGLLDGITTIVESSSGNLGVAFARQARLRGLTFRCVVDPRINSLTEKTMRAFGAVVEQVTEPDPNTRDWLAARRRRVAEILSETPDAMSFDQYSNTAAFDAHGETMAEIVAALGGAPDVLVSAMSTTGTIGGCRLHLDRIGAPTTVVGVDAHGSVLYGGQRADRRLPGYGAGVVPELSRSHTPDEVLRITDTDAVVGARLLALREGILAGASGGAVVAAVVAMSSRLAPGDRVVAILHDSGQAYLDTIYDDTWVHENLGLDPAHMEAQVEQAWSDRR